MRNTRKTLRTTEQAEGYKQRGHKLGRISDAQPSVFSVQSVVPYELHKWTVMCEIYWETSDFFTTILNIRYEKPQINFLPWHF